MSGIHKRGYIQNDAIKVGIEVFDIHLWVGSAHRVISEDTAIVLTEAMELPGEVLYVEDLSASYGHLQKRDVQYAVAQTTIDASLVFVGAQRSSLHLLSAVYENKPRASKTTSTPLRGMLGVVFNSRAENASMPYQLLDDNGSEEKVEQDTREKADIHISNMHAYEMYAAAENPIVAFLKNTPAGATLQELTACVAAKYPSLDSDSLSRKVSLYLDNVFKSKDLKIVYKKVGGVHKAFYIGEVSPYYSGNSGVHSQLGNLL